ncbi:MAG: hypothetical protein J6T10_17810 [Methanobrevibacter sp.]|nr:hypothetical protein [Methanobrevibacter sp.]
MKRREDLYNLGNDYFQKTDVYFVTADSAASAEAGIATYKAYSDGLFHFTTQPVYELSGGASALNKRIFNVPQSAWAPIDFEGASAFSAINAASAVLSEDYATGVVVGTAEIDKKWKKPE